MSIIKHTARYCVQPKGTNMFIWLPKDCEISALHYPYRIATHLGFGTLYSRFNIFVYGPCTLFVYYEDMDACIAYHDSLLGVQHLPSVYTDPPYVWLEASLTVGKRELIDNPFEKYPNMKPPPDDKEAK